MTDLAFPPGAILILAGLILPLLSDRMRRMLILLAPLLTLLAVWGRVRSNLYSKRAWPTDAPRG